MKRKIIEIDEAKCTGCGQCIPNCVEGALQLIDGKARLISDLFCDGLGACVGECPEGAMKIVEREAEPYDETRVIRQIIPQGVNTVVAHLKHLKSHGELRFLAAALAEIKAQNVKLPAWEEERPCGCPGALSRKFERPAASAAAPSGAVPSELRQWPTQLALVNPDAAFFDGADLLVSADCVPFAMGDFHRKLLRGKVVVNFCPKLDGEAIERYIEKLAHIFRTKSIRSVTVVRMEVPCCGGTEMIVREALKRANCTIDPVVKVIGLDGGDRETGGNEND